MSKRWVASLVIVAGLAATIAIAASWSWRELNSPLTIPQEGVLFTVERGAAFRSVTGELADLGILDHPRIVDVYAGFSGASTAIQAGEYELRAPLTAVELLAKLSSGDVYLHRFTIVEGWRFNDMLTRLRAHPAIEPSQLSADEIMAELGRPGEHPEGQFLPDTYSFARGTGELELLRLSHAALWDTLNDSFRENDVITDAYAGLILASIIEKETALDSERPLMSGVFHERLRRGMRLQADPTVIYGLGDAYDGDITTVQLQTDTPYNTYTRRGLPPTPIALPGSASIAAAFAPVESGALYFVATGEPDGSHVFSATLEEHNAAVQRYLERTRSGL